MLCFTGIGFALRQLGKRTTSTEEIKQVEDDWVLNILSTFKNINLVFKIGEEFDEITMDGRKCKVSAFNRLFSFRARAFSPYVNVKGTILISLISSKYIICQFNCE